MAARMAWSNINYENKQFRKIALIINLKSKLKHLSDFSKTFKISGCITNIPTFIFV